MADNYEILGLAISADSEQIKAAYRLACKRHHPDVDGGNPEKFRAIQEAYDVLSDPKSRERYDRQMGFKGTASSTSAPKTDSFTTKPKQHAPAPNGVFVEDLHPRVRPLEEWQFGIITEDSTGLFEFILDARMVPVHLPQDLRGNWEAELLQNLQNYKNKVLPSIFRLIDLEDYVQTAEERAKVYLASSSIVDYLAKDAEELLDMLFDRYIRAEAEEIAAETGENPDDIVKARYVRRFREAKEREEREEAARQERLRVQEEAAREAGMRSWVGLLSVISAFHTALVVFSFFAFDWAMGRWGVNSDRWMTLDGNIPFSSGSPVYQQVTIWVSVATTLFVARSLLGIKLLSKGWDAGWSSVVSVLLMVAALVVSIPLVIPVLAFIALLAFGLAAVAFIIFILFN